MGELYQALRCLVTLGSDMVCSDLFWLGQGADARRQALLLEDLPSSG